ncbi:hypothetical protein, partial [uncultured Brevundimonas sp.]|uniref:hypothetical protein n=1 Tax=uncultured Brevundimonas sp. TaxID=213418 RepID=UPI002592DAAB
INPLGSHNDRGTGGGHVTYMKALKTGAPVPDTFGQRLVETLIANKYARHPIRRNIDGWGLKFLP